MIAGGFEPLSLPLSTVLLCPWTRPLSLAGEFLVGDIRN